MRPLAFLPSNPPPTDNNSNLPAWITAIGTVAVAFSATLSGPIWLRVVSVGLVAAGLLAALYRPLRMGLHRWAGARHNTLSAGQSFGPLAEVCEHFTTLVDQNGSNSVDKVLQNALSQNLALWVKVGLPSMTWFSIRSAQVRERLDTDPRDFAHFLRCYKEFDSLVYEYAERCVRPVFVTHVGELRTALSPGGRASVESFRERYIAFLGEYEALIKVFAKRFRTTPSQFYPSAFRPDTITA